MTHKSEVSVVIVAHTHTQSLYTLCRLRRPTGPRSRDFVFFSDVSRLRAPSSGLAPELTCSPELPELGAPLSFVVKTLLSSLSDVGNPPPPPLLSNNMWKHTLVICYGILGSFLAVTHGLSSIESVGGNLTFLVDGDGSRIGMKN